MHLSNPLAEACTHERPTAPLARRLAEFIAWGPAVFPASRLMAKFGIRAPLRDSGDGLTRQEIVRETALSAYAVRCLPETSLSIGTILVNPDNVRHALSKVGRFLLNDPDTRVNQNFNHDVNYEGWFRLEESLRVTAVPKACRRPWFSPVPCTSATISRYILRQDLQAGIVSGVRDLTALRLQAVGDKAHHTPAGHHPADRHDAGRSAGSRCGRLCRHGTHANGRATTAIRIRRGPASGLA